MVITRTRNKTEVFVVYLIEMNLPKKELLNLHRFMNLNRWGLIGVIISLNVSGNKHSTMVEFDLFYMFDMY